MHAAARFHDKQPIDQAESDQSENAEANVINHVARVQRQIGAALVWIKISNQTVSLTYLFLFFACGGLFGKTKASRAGRRIRHVIICSR
jgi:hypothetical protein